MGSGVELLMEKSQWQGLEAAGHMTSTAKAEREGMLRVQLVPSDLP